MVGWQNQRRSALKVGLGIGCGIASVGLTVGRVLSAHPADTPIFPIPTPLQAHPPQWFATPTVPLQSALTNQEQAALRQGRVLLSGEDGNYTARVMANASIDIAWAVLTDYNNFSSFLPGVESSQVLQSSGTQRTFEQINVIRIFPITHRERIVIAASENYPSHITFSQVDGDLKKLQGSWYVTGAGGQVMITHQVVVEPASNRSIFFGIYKDNLQRTMSALQQEMERRSGR
ncbi:MAG: SRPBCC family protein [Elainella sp. Prado103]|jgi:ribosome-associated toxin RatA of RatAB toxin-antitoxin module|nr:SRPBCC family protein [Elainella sp. Prado103]